MGIERRKHFRFDELSPEGQAVVRACAEDRTRTLEATRSELQAATGEEISTGALHRWLAEERLRARLARQEQARDLMLEAVRSHPDSRAAHMVELLVEEALVQKLDFSNKDMDELLAEQRAQQRMALAHRKVELGEQLVEAEKMKAEAAVKKAEASLTQAAAAMRRVELLERQLREAAQKLEGAVSKATDGKVPAEILKETADALFGICVEAASEGSHGA